MAGKKKESRKQRRERRLERTKRCQNQSRLRNKNRGLRKRRTRLNLLKSGGSRGNKMGSLGFKKILTLAYRLRMEIYLKAKIKRDMGCILVIVLEARHAKVLARVNQEPYKFFSRDINSNSSAATLIQILQRGHRTEAIFCFHRSVSSCYDVLLCCSCHDFHRYLSNR